MSKPDKLIIEDDETLVRDVKTNAVLNTDLTSLQAYRAQRNKLRQKDEEVKSLREEIDEIKSILQLLVEKIK
jgi:hypothetical protein